MNSYLREITSIYNILIEWNIKFFYFLMMLGFYALRAHSITPDSSSLPENSGGLRPFIGSFPPQDWGICNFFVNFVRLNSEHSPGRPKPASPTQQRDTVYTCLETELAASCGSPTPAVKPDWPDGCSVCARWVA